jgi:predicted phage terminase large subunit-like protein
MKRIQLIEKFADFFNDTKNEPLVILQGSRRSGKTYQILIDLGLTFNLNKNKIIQIFSERPEQRESGLFKDFNDIWNGFNYDQHSSRTPLINKRSGSQIKFINIPNNVSAFDYAKNIGKSNIRYLNECNVFDKKTVENLIISNTEKMYLDFNPVAKFWIDDYITKSNFLQTTWKDNPFLTEVQKEVFKSWTKLGQAAEVGSYNYWRWQVLCEGNYCELVGSIFTTENLRFTQLTEKEINELEHLIIFGDPSKATGHDYFALTLTGITQDGKMILIDSFSENKLHRKLIADQIKAWQKQYDIERTFIETNGEIGKGFYNDCINNEIPVNGWYSKNNKFERIMANYETITDKVLIQDNSNNRNFAKQIYQFKQNAEKENIHDDNIDCLNNAIIAYKSIYRILGGSFGD